MTSVADTALGRRGRPPVAPAPPATPASPAPFRDSNCVSNKTAAISEITDNRYETTARQLVPQLVPNLLMRTGANCVCWRPVLTNLQLIKCKRIVCKLVMNEAARLFVGWPLWGYARITT
ncbi:hypothetical protein JYU34_003990 [Plutella xylostella]|uniref:Uncharacterized protein n=1 Tax=Plutella xylostella TaxID=51655 RepID=A0ABQ7QX07_PLUXY|nr:hypothetical protein JYU34_003990 [Plutella xylostella]